MYSCILLLLERILKLNSCIKVVKGGFGKKSPKTCFFGTKPRLLPLSAAPIGSTQRVLKPDMHSLELYLW